MPPMLSTATLFGPREEHPVRVRDERRALSAGGDVGGAEVGDDGEARARGDDGGVADLEGGAARDVPDGLAVRADQVGAPAQPNGRFPERLSEDGAGFAEFGSGGVVGGEDAAAEGGGGPSASGTSTGRLCVA